MARPLWRPDNGAVCRVPARGVAPLLPGEDAQLVLSDSGARVRFEIRRGEVLLARGAIEGAPA